MIRVHAVVVPSFDDKVDGVSKNDDSTESRNERFVNLDLTEVKRRSYMFPAGSLRMSPK